ncbi:MAG: DAK2 domain-containing protein [Mycobacterium sp.]
MADRRLDAAFLRQWAHVCVGDLITHIDEINQLNVFPVPDADTGTNMLFTMRAALARADASPDTDAPDTDAPADDVATVAAALAAGAHEGARGNSGVILSQILRGIAEVCADATPLTGIGACVLGAGLRHAVALVVAAMGAAVPGTIVTVLQAAAQAVEDAAADGDDVAQAVAAAADAATVALEKTTEQLDVLAQAGVVDAGGRGLLVLLDALNTTLTGEAPPRRHYRPARPPHPHDAQLGHAPPKFEVMYQLTGCDADGVQALRAQLTRIGDSVVIAADSGEMHSVHVHADDAGGAIEAGLAAGSVSAIQVTALTSAAVASAGGWARQRAVLAVVDGDGAEQLFTTEGAFVVSPVRDATGTPSAVPSSQLLRAIVDTAAAQVLVLPNGFVAAEELVAACTAANGWGIDVVPLPTGSMVAGLAALAVHDPERPPVDDGYTMARAAASARYGSVRVAIEEALTWAGPCRPGDGLGIAGDEVLIVGPDITAAGAGLIDLLMVAGGELITVLLGSDVDAQVGYQLSAHVHRQHLGVELVTYQTGHRGDALLIGVE